MELKIKKTDVNSGLSARLQSLWERKQNPIAAIALGAIALSLCLHFGVGATARDSNLPLQIALILGGIPLVVELLIKLFQREFGSDLLAGLSIVTAVLLQEYLAGTIVVLMLSGGEAIEAFAVRRASRSGLRGE